MIEEQDNQRQENENKPFMGLNKALAIMFVFAIYLVIFLKIIFIK
jgi:hypothetical protein